MWQNLKVVELTSVLAGPLVGSFFSELGAEVVKIENKLQGGDVTRNWKLAEEDPKRKFSAYYASANYDKKSLLLDYTDPDDYSQTIQLIKNADIVLQNFKPGDDVKLKLEAERLLALKPELIIGCLNGFGKANTRPAFDVVLQAESGFMHMNGTPESGPVKMPVALIDVLAAHHLKEAILIALIEKVQHGNGKIVHVSLYDAALASLANQANNWLMTKHIPQAIGTKHPNIALYGDHFTTKDHKHYVLAIGSNKHFIKLCDSLNFSQNVRNCYNSNAKRIKNRTILNKLIASKISNLQSVELVEIFSKNLVPYGEIKDLEGVFNQPLAHNLVLKHQIDGEECTYIKTLLH